MNLLESVNYCRVDQYKKFGQNVKSSQCDVKMCLRLYWIFIQFLNYSNDVKLVQLLCDECKSFSIRCSNYVRTSNLFVL